MRHCKNKKLSDRINAELAKMKNIVRDLELVDNERVVYDKPVIATEENIEEILESIRHIVREANKSIDQSE